jgi:DNA-directed RNA polymerase subunit RPC12/RpoP
VKECVVCGSEFDADYDDIVCEDCNIRLAISIYEDMPVNVENADGRKVNE